MGMGAAVLQYRRRRLRGKRPRSPGARTASAASPPGPFPGGRAAPRAVCPGAGDAAAARRRLRGKQPAGRTCAAAQVPGRRPQAAAAAEVPGRWLERSASGELVWVVCAPAQPRAGPGAPPPAARGAAPEAPPLPQDAPGDAASSSSTGAPGHQLAPLGFDALAEALDKVRAKVSEALALRREEVPSEHRDSLPDLALEIAWEFRRQLPNPYAQLRALLWNLRDPKNPDFVRGVASREVLPEQLPTLAPQEMASAGKRAERAALLERAAREVTLARGVSGAIDRNALESFRALKTR
ncbi:unnamed protein product [Prorocentrum cordatum]|uniref:TFIIS central domain-containing protein n=1 Tax=Prorocentrum cordatum TaxID=2364126 RepID=A0ABN9UEL6_9DINO|nr:unnamed protein product [Polarella glacialis]